MSRENFVIREMLAGEEEMVCDLVLEVFDRFVAADFSQQGIDEFRGYVHAEALERRTHEGHTVLLAVEDDTLLGMIETRAGNHISLLFVREEHQGRGIGRALVMGTCQSWDESQESPMSVTVHASLDSVGFYRRVGFLPEGSERIENGIRYIPMRWDRF
jgi:GNAT superfamily N-acetyltransferase